MELIKNQRINNILGSVDIDINSNMVWDVISSPGILKKCHPFCKDNVVLNWCGVGSEDVIHYYNGLTLNRYCTKWESGKGFELLIGNNTYATAKVTWKITPLNSNRSNLSIHIEVFSDIALKKFYLPLRILIKYLYFLPNMKKYIQSVVLGVKYYIESNASVKKNQFGYNKMFSTK